MNWCCSRRMYEFWGESSTGCAEAITLEIASSTSRSATSSEPWRSSTPKILRSTASIWEMVLLLMMCIGTPRVPASRSRFGCRFSCDFRVSSRSASDRVLAISTGTRNSRIARSSRFRLTAYG